MTMHFAGNNLYRNDEDGGIYFQDAGSYYGPYDDYDTARLAYQSYMKRKLADMGILVQLSDTTLQPDLVISELPVTFIPPVIPPTPPTPPKTLGTIG